MRQDRKYLKDISFLMDLTRRRNKEVYVKVISLDFATENENGEIEGLIISGNLSVDGGSAVRRTGNLSIFCNTKIHEKDALVKDINYYKQFFGISKKINIEIGLNNDFNNKYPKIIWFQMGTYILTNATFANNVNGGITININIGDKMNLLNGYCGGTINSSIEVDKVSDIDETGKIYERRASIYEMIYEMVNHLGGEELGRILISDLETTTKTGLRIKSDSSKVYYLENNENNIEIKEYIEGVSPVGVETFKAGDFIGYKSIDYTYPTKDYFTLNTGDSVITGLDKIKTTLGNYEYFYDLDGNFRWQEIKNYKNTSKATIDLKNLTNEDYLIDRDNGNAFYNFEDSDIIISYNNSPQYSNLKNDFVIWGTRTVGEGSDKKTFPIRYHLAIDDKPEVSENMDEDNIYLIIEDDSSEGEKKYKAPIFYERIDQLPSIGREDVIYFIQENQQLYKYNPTGNQYIKTFSKSIKNLNENIDTFYDLYSSLLEESQNLQAKKKNEVSEIKSIYLNIQNFISDIINFTDNIKESLNNEITTKRLSIICQSMKDELNQYLNKSVEIESFLNNYIDGNYVNEHGNKIVYSKEKNLPKINSLLKNFERTNFYKGYQDIIKNLYSFDYDFLTKYRDEYINKIKKYNILLNKYYDYFVNYERAKTTTEKNKIKNEANSIFIFTQTNVSTLLDSLNEDIFIDKPTVSKYQKIVNQRVKILNNILKAIGITGVTTDNKFILNTDYKIGADTASAQSVKRYIDNLSEDFFNDNLLNIFIDLFKEEFNVLNNYEESFQSSWEDSALISELDSSQEKILKSILITTLYPLSDMGSLLDKNMSIIYIYNDKDNFPVEISNDGTIGFMDGGTGDVYISSSKAGYYIASGISTIKYVFPQDWRTILLLQNLDTYASENNIYGVELESEWSKIFDLVPYVDKNGQNVYKNNHIVYTDKIKDSVYTKPDLLDYWLDFIDSKTMDFNELKISNIGRRTLVKKNDRVNCLFAPQIPDYIIIEDIEENKKSIQELENKGQQYILVDSTFLNDCDTNGLTLYSAFDSISNSLYDYLNYNNTINITCLPMFFLEPNIRIKLRDEASDIYGDYIIKSFSISLNNLSTMNITCTKIIDSI